MPSNISLKKDSNLTIHLIISQETPKLEAVLSSLVKLKANVILAPTKSSICPQIDSFKKRQLCSEVLKLPFLNDFSEFRNRIITFCKTDWLMYLEPWELLANFSPILSILGETPQVVYLPIHNHGTIINEPRLWHKSLNLKFYNPIFEYLDVVGDKKTLKNCPIVILENKPLEETESLLDNWISRQPHSHQPYYYRALFRLRNKQYDAFISDAEKYLFSAKTDDSVCLMKYYLALVRFYKKEYKKAVKDCLICLSSRLFLAEVWCLLGDIHCRVGRYDKAIGFYENAMILGSRRKVDEFPLDIDKYKKYPEQMILACKKVLDRVTKV